MGRFLLFLTLLADVVAAGASTLFGSVVLPWASATLAWFWSGLISHMFILATAPYLMPFLLHSFTPLGWVWLCYYLMTHLCSPATPSPHPPYPAQPAPQEQTPPPLVSSYYHDAVSPPRWVVSSVAPPSTEVALPQQPDTTVHQHIPLSRGWPGSQKWELVEQCYQRYREALQRFSPRPTTLRTPTGFRYQKVINEISWVGRTLLLPDQLLDPARIHLLLPALARELAFYNSADLWIRTVMERYPNGFSAFFFFTGNFLWLPASIKLIWKQGQADRVLDADRFAFYLGQGEALLHLFRMQQVGQELSSDYPTLDERIDHLEALVNAEHKQMRDVGLTPPAPPVVQQPTHQLNKPKKRHPPHLP